MRQPKESKVRLSIPRSRLFALERMIDGLYEAGAPGHLAAEVGRLAAQLPAGPLCEGGAASASALGRTGITSAQRGYALDFALEWIRKLHNACAFAAEPRIDDGAYVLFLRAALREDAKTVGSEALSLFDVARKARLSLEAVDAAAARAFDDELMYHTSLDDRAFAVLLEPDEEVQAAIDDLVSQHSPEDLAQMPDPPTFPSDEVNQCLESPVASKRQRGFALAEEAVGKGASMPAWTLRLIAGIALRATASASDRWRAIELLRYIGIDDEVRDALVREWTLTRDSTIGPTEYDSGPMFYVVRDLRPAFEQALALLVHTQLAEVSRFVIRDLLVAIRTELTQHPERIQDDEVPAWRAFCERVRLLDAATAPSNERSLIDAIIKAIDG